MSYSINRRPLLGGASDSEFEDDLETEIDDPNIVIPDEKPFLKSYEPQDKYVSMLQFRFKNLFSCNFLCMTFFIFIFFNFCISGIILHI